MKLDLPSHFQGQFHNIVLPNEGDRVTICEKLIETILQDIHRVPEVLQACQGRQDPDVIEAFRRHHFLEKDWVVLQRRSNPAKSRAKK